MIESYEALAKRLGIILCVGCTDKSAHQHQVGLVEFDDPHYPHQYLHWSERKPNRLGMRNFLLKAGILLARMDKRVPKWERVYMSNVFATKVAAELHIQFPRSYSAVDRAWLSWYMATHTERQYPGAMRRWAERNPHE